jgi:hypothetical protein
MCDAYEELDAYVVRRSGGSTHGGWIRPCRMGVGRACPNTAVLRDLAGVTEHVSWDSDEGATGYFSLGCSRWPVSYLYFSARVRRAPSLLGKTKLARPRPRRSSR